MKLRSVVWALLLLIGLASLFWWAKRGTRNALQEPKVAASAGTNRAQVDAPPQPSSFIEHIDTNALPWLQRLSDFSVKANLYNYDPALLDFDSKTNHVGKELQWWVHLATKSHIASFYQGKLITVQSLYDSSDERRKPEVMNDWYKCTARWSEKEAIDTTIAILRNLGDTGRLAEALRAPVEYRAPELTLKAPDGTIVKATPFPKVSIGDLVTAEYRMGSTGVLGLVRWFNNR